MNKHKEYLGDAVYVSFDGYGLELTTEDGIRTTNTIYLEPEMLRELNLYAARLQSQYPGWRKAL